MSVQRIFVEKKKEHAVEADKLLKSLKEDLEVEKIEGLSILNRYDIEGISPEELKPALKTVFSEPMTDSLYIEDYPFFEGSEVFAAEYLPGQYDQRSDSAEQCVQVLTGAENVTVKTAKVYILKGALSQKDVIKIKNYIINKIDRREASMEKPDTLAVSFLPPEETGKAAGFTEMDENELSGFLKNRGLAMSMEDLKFLRDYFKNEEGRDPTETEIKVLDTYWSDHCRHTTFNTVLKNIEIEDGPYADLFKKALELYRNMRAQVYGENAPSETLMDMAVIGAKDAGKRGKLPNLEISEENNACSIEISVKTDKGTEPWLLQFKNETHNHPTEIEPFGGAATCLGGAIRDPLSGRAYVYQAMRITGAADPRKSLAETPEGKLSQKKITREAAAGFSSYGNQIGVATGFVREFYHEGFAAKRLEAGAVIGAVPKKNVRRETPAPGDAVILIGGRTGRDGVGGATGSSKEHDVSSIELCGAEVQKGNAPEEHKIQRLFRKKEVAALIKKCNDFGAGGVSVAIGELASGLLIDLDKVPKKYSGLTGTEIAVSESQERMAVVTEEAHVEKFIEECSKENLEATKVAEVTDTARLRMTHRGKTIVDISRKFLDSAGAPRSREALIANPSGESYFSRKKKRGAESFLKTAEKILTDLNVCSQKGLVEMFDSTIGSGSVLMPFGGVTGRSPAESMAAKIPVTCGETSAISVASSGYDPYISSWSPFHGGLYAVIESAAKAVAAGARLEDLRLSFQEYFEKLGADKEKWGKPAAALLGALQAQWELGIAAIGGKDSMSGTFQDKSSGKEINVPPTLISFAVAPSDVSKIITPEFKPGGRAVYLIKTGIGEDGIPDFADFRENVVALAGLIENKSITAVYTVKSGGAVESLLKMAFGNETGLALCGEISLEELAYPYYGSFVVQAGDGFNPAALRNILKLGVTLGEPIVKYREETEPLDKLFALWSGPLESVFPSKTKDAGKILSPRDYNGKTSLVKSSYRAKPAVAILALPGTNCEYDTKRIFELSGSRETEPFIFLNRTAKEAGESCLAFAKIIENSQILAVPGGFSAGDEPEGSGKFYVSVFKNPRVREAVENLIYKRDGLIIGVCNGFQALIKSGLLTRGHICDLGSEDATISFNSIGRHVSQIVRTRVASVNSPWMALRKVGEIDVVPVSHGEGRFTAPEALIDELFKNGQVLFQYADNEGNITMESPYNPNGSGWAIEGICSPDGRVLGKMAHGERLGTGVHMNAAYGNMDQRIFEAGVRYFTGK